MVLKLYYFCCCSSNFVFVFLLLLSMSIIWRCECEGEGEGLEENVLRWTFWKKSGDDCCILSLDWAVNQRCTCVNKRKKKRKQECVMKEYRQMPAAVESVETGRPEWGPAYRPRDLALSDSRLSNPSQDAEEVISGLLKITQSTMFNRMSWFNIEVCLFLQSSLTHHRLINLFGNKVWEIYFW